MQELKPPLEEILSKTSKQELLSFMDAYPERIQGLMQLACSHNPPHSARAAWLLSKITVGNEDSIKKCVHDILDILPKVSDGQQRDLINVLRAMELNEEEEGKLYEICVELWVELSKIPSVRYVAFHYMVAVCRKYPVLRTELILLTEDHYLETLSSGIQQSLMKMANKLKKEME